MIEINAKWTNENLTQYVKYITFHKGKLNKIVFMILGILYLLIIAACIVFFFITKLSFTLIAAGVFTLFLILSGLVFYLMIKDFVNKTLKENENPLFDQVLVSENNIFVCKADRLVGELDWENVIRIYFNDKAGAIYLCTSDNAVIILEYNNITAGTSEKLKEIVKAKYDKLPKKA